MSISRRGIFGAIGAAVASRAVRAQGGPGMLLRVRGGQFERVSNGQRVWLGGGGMGWELQDYAWDGELPRALHFEDYLRALKRAGCNLMHVWVVEHEMTQARRRAARHMPFKKVRGRWDYDQVNGPYFKRLRHRVTRLRAEGMYALVMLFQGASIWRQRPGFQWYSWPWHYLEQSGGRRRDKAHDVPLHHAQRRYLEEVVHACRGRENVLWEVANEDRDGTVEWQEAVMEFVRELDPLDRPVGMTFRQTLPKTKVNKQRNQEELRTSSADWVGPKFNIGVQNRPGMRGKAVLCMDDHFDPFAEIKRNGQVVGTKLWYPGRSEDIGCAGYVHLDGGMPWYGGRRGARARYLEGLHSEFREAIGDVVRST